MMMKVQWLEWLFERLEPWFKGFQEDGVFKTLGFLGRIILGVILRQFFQRLFTPIWIKYQTKRKTTTMKNPTPSKKQDSALGKH